jgi:hypothetical protein
MMRSLVCVLAVIVCASPALAQQGVQFLPRYDFHLAADHLSSDDPKFVWDTNFGGDLDFVDYGFGRARFAANYEAVLGDEFRAFDPNQGNYLLDLSSSLRGRGVEVAGLFHHLSRHLSDRFKRIPVDWNMLGVSLAHDARHGRTQVDVHGNLLGVLLKSNVDYDWEANGAINLRVPVRSHVGVVAGGAVRFIGVDDTRTRGTQRGARGEAGVRFEGETGAVELIVAAERRPDAYPLQDATRSWVSAGFRFVSR